VNNRSSVGYNIVSHEKHSVSGTLVINLLDKNVTNRKKGVAEISELGRPFNEHWNNHYNDIYSKKPNVFRVYNGIFSHMYDAAHRNGNMVVPFRDADQLNKIKEGRREKRDRHSKSPKNKNKVN
jgi:hypothetical protein